MSKTENVPGLNSSPGLSSSLGLEQKLALLAAAARYDAACSSSGSTRNGTGLGAAHKSGVCHSWSADGRCISLLKVLYSNECRYDCAYCLNRRSNDHRRARFTPRELADLTIDFYRRNYIEGLFLSSAVFAGPDDTMLELIRTLEHLRHDRHFHGYIHLKVIPGCSRDLLGRAAVLADRMSANVELPSAKSLQLLAPEKKEKEILGVFRDAHDLQQSLPTRGKERKLAAPAGLSTQMIVGATPEPDRLILARAGQLYRLPQLKRVYYSAYIPVNSDTRLPAVETGPPLLREHRLYQADWLLRFYAFRVEEILAADQLFLDHDIDPKAAWALRHLEHFPLNVNRATQQELLRVPGIGVRSAGRILRARGQAALRLEDLQRLGVVMKRARYFLHDGFRTANDVPFRPETIRRALTGPAGRNRQQQLAFDFSRQETAISAVTGEL